MANNYHIEKHSYGGFRSHTKTWILDSTPYQLCDISFLRASVS